jgi:hypothetical protein
VVLTIHPHLAPRLKIAYSSKSTPPLCLRYRLLGELHINLRLENEVPWDGDKWPAIVSMVINLRVPYKDENFMTG